MLDHLSIQCSDVAASTAFYDSLLTPLGGGRVMDFGEVVGYGVAGRPVFWIGPWRTGGGVREAHIAFAAPGRSPVRGFFHAPGGGGAGGREQPRPGPADHGPPLRA